MLTLNDPRINTASFEQIEYSLPQDKRKGEVVMSFCRLMPQFSKPKRQYKRLYKHVENSTEYYDTYRKDYDRNTTAIVTGAMVLSADA